MEHCETREELAIQYVMALDSVTSAKRDVRMAVTQTQIECASTLLYRVEAHKLTMLNELVSHVEEHACATKEINELMADNRVMVARSK